MGQPINQDYTQQRVQQFIEVPAVPADHPHPEQHDPFGMAVWVMVISGTAVAGIVAGGRYLWRLIKRDIRGDAL